MPYEQPLAWLTVNGCPAIVSVPVRAGPESAAAVNVTVPFPLPLAPAVIVSQLSAVAAVQVHPAAVVTVTGVPAPPAAPIDWLEGFIAYEQPFVCVSVNV
jgi:hypothetical protein